MKDIKFHDNTQSQVIRLAKDFMRECINKQEFIIDSKIFPSRDVREYLQVNWYVCSPIKGLYILKDCKLPNNLVLEQNYFSILWRLWGIVSWDLALDYHLWKSIKRENIVILTETKNGFSTLKDSNYKIRYKKIFTNRQGIKCEIQGASMLIESNLSFIMNEFDAYKNDSDFLVLLRSTQISFQELWEMISKWVNLTNLSKLAFFYNKEENARNYVIIKNELAKQGKKLNYWVTEKGSDAFIPIIHYQQNEFAENVKITRFKNFIHKITNDLSYFPTDLHQLSLLEVTKWIDSNIVHDTYHSLTIERYKVSLKDIELLNEWDSEAEDIENRLIIKWYLDAFRFVKESIVYDFKSNIPITHDFIHSIHQKLFQQIWELKGFCIPKEYRKSQNQITWTSFIPPDFTYVDEYMDVFLKTINSIQTNDFRGAIRKAILAHCLLVYIHPYLDGNGRVARFLMNYILCTNGIAWKVIKENKREEYVNALKQVSENENITTFNTFIVEN